MGGKALTTSTRRLSAPEFHALAAGLPARLALRLGARVEPVPAYRLKPDFGDLDLLVDADALEKRFGAAWPQALDEVARDVSHARQVLVNGSRKEGRLVIDTSIVSYDHREAPSLQEGFQVDLILTRAAVFDAARNYYAYNDLGNLIGRVARRLGFVYGHRGLLYALRKGECHLIAMLPVSRDTDAVLGFLGYEPRTFRRGFDTLDEVFDYAASSRYFHRSIYRLENRNHHSRMRDRKRPTYAAFLEALDANHHWVDREAPDHGVALHGAFAAFPSFAAAHAAALTSTPAKGRLRTLFSGANVEAWTGLRGPSVGRLMAQVRQAFPSGDAFAAWVGEVGEEGLRARVLAALPDGALPARHRHQP